MNWHVAWFPIFFPGFNSNINLPGREECGSAPTSPSLQLQDKNANNHTHPHSSSPAPVENGNQISNGNSALHIYADYSKAHYLPYRLSKWIDAKGDTDNKY